MELRNVLKESFRMLMDRPRLFVPKLASTTVSTIWILSFAGLYTGPLYQVETSTVLLYLASTPFIVFLGVFVSVMLAEMVDGPQELRRGFFKALEKWKILLAVSLGLIISGVLLYIPFALGFTLYVLTGSLPVLLIGGAVTVLLMMLMSFSIFFLPISIVKQGETLEGLKKSVAASRSNSREVTVILVFSIALLLLSFTAQGSLKHLGMAGFAAGRILSSVVTTYLFVVSPKMYLENETV